VNAKEEKAPQRPPLNGRRRPSEKKIKQATANLKGRRRD
jgi:hypothetical protein